MLSTIPFGAAPQDTGEFLLGDIDVNVVLMESTAPEDFETWTTQSIDVVKQKVTTALEWWEDALDELGTAHSVRFHPDFNYADNPVPTDVEPIARRSNDYVIWVNDFLDHVGGNSTSGISTDMRLFNHAQRVETGHDWAFTIFVVNDENDSDGLFASGGSFRKAFAFPGGRYFIVPAGRPDTTFVHELGHIFWARDEYSGGGSYTDKRGYYNAQNLNAHDNPEPGFVQQDSIMANGGLLTDAFANHMTSDSSMKMIGWQDSDSDGVFDVLDVDHTLVGTGSLTSEADEYRFVGYATVNTLINTNSAGFQSDITLNEIDHVQYRLDDGSWTTAVMPGTPTASIDFVVHVPDGTSNIDIRTVSIDDGTGLITATSNVYSGSVSSQDVTPLSGVRGIVWSDLDKDGQRDFGEPGLSEIPVQLVDGSGQLAELHINVEPDNYQDNNVINSLVPGVTVSAIGNGVMDNEVFSRVRGQSSTGSRVFAVESTSTFSVITEWDTKTRMLKAEFDTPVSMVSMDAIGDDDGDYGRLEAYDVNGNLLGRYTTHGLTSGEQATMSLVSDQADISYVIARAHYNTDVHLDNLVIGPATESQTGLLGEYWIPWLIPDDYEVAVQLPSGWVTVGADSTNVTVGEGESVRVDFAVTTPPWHNTNSPEDVNDDGDIVPLDALIVVNDLNANGSRLLAFPSEGDEPPPYLDVNGDGSITPIDALRIINKLNDAELEGESLVGLPMASVPVDNAIGSVEGESFTDLRLSDSEKEASDSVATDESVGNVQNEYRPTLSQFGIEKWFSRYADANHQNEDDINRDWDDLLTSLAQDCLHTLEDDV
ncbi:MAG: dockerin type I domain-containing protein [Pirellulaceae bacterium]